jgi:hypothetical protein
MPVECPLNARRMILRPIAAGGWLGDAQDEQSGDDAGDERDEEKETPGQDESDTDSSLTDTEDNEDMDEKTCDVCREDTRVTWICRGCCRCFGQ